MKNLIVSSLFGILLLSAQSSFASVPEECWTKRQPGQEIGQFTVNIDTTNLSKEDLMKDMGRLTENLQIYSTDILFVADQNWVTMVLSPNAVTTTYLPDGTKVDETQEHIAARVNPEIKRLMTLPGVTINCFVHVLHNGGVSLSN